MRWSRAAAWCWARSKPCAARRGGACCWKTRASACIGGRERVPGNRGSDGRASCPARGGRAGGGGAGQLRRHHPARPARPGGGIPMPTEIQAEVSAIGYLFFDGRLPPPALIRGAALSRVRSAVGH